MDSFFNNVHVTTVLTGLLFNDVVVHGNNIQGGSFGRRYEVFGEHGSPFRDPTARAVGFRQKSNVTSRGVSANSSFRGKSCLPQL
jgi:hypothetical protein